MISEMCALVLGVTIIDVRFIIYNVLPCKDIEEYVGHIRTGSYMIPSQIVHVVCDSMYEYDSMNRLTITNKNK